MTKRPMACCPTQQTLSDELDRLGLDRLAYLARRGRFCDIHTGSATPKMDLTRALEEKPDGGALATRVIDGELDATGEKWQRAQR